MVEHAGEAGLNHRQPSFRVGGHSLYLWAFAAVALAVFLRLLVADQFGYSAPYLTVYPVVVIVSLYLGLGPGLLASVAGAVAAELVLVEPLRAWPLDPAGLLRASVLVASSVIFGYVGHLLHRERDHALIVLERITDAFFALDHHSRLIYVNAQAQTILGSGNDLRGKSIWDCLPQAWGTLIHRKCREAIRRQQAVHFETFYEPHGRWYEVHAYPGGKGLSVYFNDVTEHRQAEESLRESRERFRTLADASFEGICISELGIIQDCNDQFAAMLGYTRAELLGKSLPDTLLPEEWHDIVVERLRGDVETRLDHEMLCKDGTRRNVEAHGRRILDQGRPVRISVFRDITERKQAERERQVLLEAERAARNEAERLNRVKDEFLATVSHELRNPLNAILGWARLLAQGRVQDVGHVSEIIARNASVLSRLVSDLLDMGRIASGKIQLNPESVAVEPLIKGIVEAQQMAAQAKDLTINQRLGPHLEDLWCDRNRVEQILCNLFSNAIKFTPAGGRITLRVEQIDQDTVFTVEDTGEGIAPEFLPHVFDKFVQADASSARQHGGLGLGLAIVKDLVELHGGSVDAHSDGLGLGSRFTVRLPFARTASCEPMPAQPCPVQDLEAESEQAAATLLKGLTILVVDDDPDTCDLVQHLLADVGATVHTTRSARTAMGMLAQCRPDVLVSDIGMPGEDGYDLVQRVRSLPDPQGSIPCIALTALARPDDRKRALRLGFESHITKPVNPNELIHAIAELTRPPELPPRIARTSVDRSNASGPSDQVGEPCHILLAEDHASVAEMIKLTLESSGYKVRVADSVAGAVKMARQVPVDLLLSDLRLPDGTGWDLMGRLREVGPIRGIAMSGYSDEVYVQKSKSAGFVEHLVKPVDETVLLAAVRKVLS